MSSCEVEIRKKFLRVNSSLLGSGQSKALKMSGVTSRSTWPRLDMAVRQTTNLLTLLCFGQLLNLAKHFPTRYREKGYSEIERGKHT